MSENNKTLQDILKNYQDIEMKIVESNGEMALMVKFCDAIHNTRTVIFGEKQKQI